MFKFTPNFNTYNFLKYNSTNNTVSFYSRTKYEKCEYTVSIKDFELFCNSLELLLDNCKLISNQIKTNDQNKLCTEIVENSEDNVKKT